jgi:hypothetical protein
MFMEITVDPGDQSSYYWSHYFTFEGGDGGYMGLQTKGWMWDHVVPRMAIFSIWNSLEAEPGPDAVAGEFGGEGEGLSCRLAYDWKPGNVYICDIHQDEIASDGVWWAASIHDASTGEEAVLGRIRTPSSWLALEPRSCFFTEHFRSVPSCSDTPLAEAIVQKVEGTIRTPQGALEDLASPYQARLVYPDACPCQNAVVSVDASHVITVRTGGSTTRESSESYYLWSRSGDPSAAAFRVDRLGGVLGDGAFYGSSFSAGSADVAEWVPVSGAVEAGTVLELDTVAPGSYRATRGSCSGLVAGVVSSQPGMILGGPPSAEGMALVALTGIVPVKVTNEGGPIQPGDLLVSSSTPGYAMRWPGPDPCPCALVGKALEPMADERGVISVLLTAH